MKEGKEITHKDDGGKLVVVKFKEGVEIVCKKCLTTWELDLPYALGMPADWTDDIKKFNSTKYVN
jgi:hypothetical protein